MEPGGQLDMQQLLAAAAQVQSQLASAQQQLAETEITGTAGGGLVTATVNGQGELIDLEIKPGAIDVTDPAEAAQTLADLVLAACRDAYRALGEAQADMISPLTGMLGQGLGGLPGMPGAGGLPGIPGLPGDPAVGESGGS
ncbi:MAG: YbaB/EbfC family nucleoid-associated protein [Streptosporangiaceae bacterium]